MSLVFFITILLIVGGGHLVSFGRKGLREGGFLTSTVALLFVFTGGLFLLVGLSTLASLAGL